MRKRSIIVLVAVLLACSLAVVGCQSSPGQEYIGKWVNPGNPQDTLEITRNSDQFLLILAKNGERQPAIFKDGSIVSSATGIRFTHIKDSDTLTAAAFGMTGEWKRDQ
jgi:hypothetical protein